MQSSAYEEGQELQEGLGLGKGSLHLVFNDKPGLSVIQPQEVMQRYLEENAFLGKPSRKNTVLANKLISV